jgi:hypothetical protein
MKKQKMNNWIALQLHNITMILGLPKTIKMKGTKHSILWAEMILL